MKILIPPSEGKSTINQSNKTFRETNSSFNEPISKILDSLKDMESSRLPKLYGTSAEKSLVLHDFDLKTIPVMSAGSVVVLPQFPPAPILPDDFSDATNATRSAAS